MRQYGLTEERYLTLVEKQNGVCAICGLHPTGRSKGGKLHVDHCHNSRKTRGLLCGKCNTLLGLADEDPAILLVAIAYLKKWSDG